MVRAVTSLPLALLFIAIAVTLNGQSTTAATLSGPAPEAVEKAFTGEVRYYDVRSNKEIVFNCNLAGTITWQINGTDYEKADTSHHYVRESSSGVENGQLIIYAPLSEDDHGEYSCSNGAKTQTWKLMLRPRANLQLA